MIARRLAPALSCLIAAGCTFQPGTGFATLRTAAVSASFQPPAGRLDERGGLKTDNGYRIELTSLAVKVKDLGFQSVTVSSGGATGATFDPAKPPPGYSLCHNGHCHRNDGALIDYADVQAELAGGTNKTLTVLSVPFNRDLSLLQGTNQVSLVPCGTGCRLDRNTWSRAVLTLDSLDAGGTVADATPEGRLGGAPRTWSLHLVPAPLTKTIAVSVDRQIPADLAAVATLGVSEKLFDGIAWQDLTKSPGTLSLDADPAARDLLGANLAESNLTVTVSQARP